VICTLDPDEERMLHEDYDHKGSVAKKKKTLVLSLKRLGAKTN
jgi:hypothetical protein